jgi:hypothetical protein
MPYSWSFIKLRNSLRLYLDVVTQDLIVILLSHSYFDWALHISDNVCRVERIACITDGAFHV